jgi:hypothetical protein
LSPDYIGIELGIGESLLIKAIGESTGRSIAVIKGELKKEGDLGLVAMVGSVGPIRVPLQVVEFSCAELQKQPEDTIQANAAHRPSGIFKPTGDRALFRAFCDVARPFAVFVLSDTVSITVSGQESCYHHETPRFVPRL